MIGNKTIIWALVMILLVFIVSGYNDLNEGILASWGLNGNANDDIGNNVLSTNQTPVVNPVSSCVVGTCYSYNGSQGHYNDSTSGLPTTGDRTISAWVYFNDTSIPDGYNIGFALGSNVYNQMEGAYVDPYLNLFLSNRGGGLSVYTGMIPTAKKWYHFLIMSNSTHAITYINNTLWNVSTKPTPSTDNKMSIGHWIGQTNLKWWLVGSVDSIMIWDRLLSSDEISFLYNNTKGREYPFGSPNTSTVSINSSDGLNSSAEDLNCYGRVIDNNVGDKMNVSFTWYKNGVINLTQNLSNSYANNTEVSTSLGSGNISVNDNWNCSMNVFDGISSSGWSNSSNLFIISYTPVVAVNVSNYNVIRNINFYLNVSLTNNWNESPKCSVIDNVSWMSCTPTEESISLADNETTMTCTTTNDRKTENITIYANCTSKNFHINSTVYSILYNVEPPHIIQTLPAFDNTSWFVNDSSFTFDITASTSTDIVNISWINITCTDSSTDIIWGNMTQYSPTVQSVSYDSISYNFTSEDTINCSVLVEDETGIENTTSINISVVEKPSTNIDSIRQANNSFDVEITTFFNGDSASCVLVSNETSVVCGGSNGTSPLTVSCTVVSGTNLNVSLNVSCNSSQRSYVNNVNSTNYAMVVDNVEPAIYAVSFNINRTYFRDYITGNFSFRDNISLYRWNVSIDGITVDSAENVDYLNVTYNLSVDPTTLRSGLHTLFIEVADGHTAYNIPQYDVKRGNLLFNNYLEFDTPDGNNIIVSAKEGSIYDSFNYDKESDKYKFSYTPYYSSKERPAKLLPGQVREYRFIVQTKKEPHIVSRPNTPYKKWIVSGNQWIDFYGSDVDNSKVRINKVIGKDNQLEVIVYSLTDDKIKFNSVGELNKINATYTFFSVNYTTQYESVIFEGNSFPITFKMNITNTSYEIDNITAKLYYNGINQTTVKTSDSNYIYYNATVTTNNYQSTQDVSFYWNVTTTIEGFGNVTVFNHTVVFISLNTTCDDQSIEALRLDSRLETSPKTNISDLINMSLNLHIDFKNETSIIKKMGFNFSGNKSYPLCISPNTTSYIIDTRMEYGDGSAYTYRKYFLNNYTINNVSDSIILYHLEEDNASDIVMTVYDKTTGKRIKDAYVKILRYYPGLDNSTDSAYKTVEVEKTNVDGESLGKMVLADVWYKFIVESPAGVVRLNTDIEKIMDTTKLLPISLSTGNLLDYNDLLGISSEVSCTKSTKICRFTWSSNDNSEKTGELRVYEDTGFTKRVIHTSSATSSAATLSYLISENTTGKKYIAQGWIIE